MNNIKATKINSKTRATILILLCVVKQALNSCIEIKSIISAGYSNTQNQSPFIFDYDPKYYSLSFYFRTNFPSSKTQMTIISFRDQLQK